jgi:hypothetical protein
MKHGRVGVCSDAGPTSRRRALARRWTATGLLAIVLAAPAGVRGEPYFAVQQGAKCVTCHVNATGGGMRNAYGSTWGQRALPAQFVETGAAEDWTGRLNPYFALGGNLRANASYTDVPNQTSTNEFDVEELRLYLLVDAIPERLSVYVDERVAPGSAVNLEAWGRYWFADQRWYVKAGQMFLPFGLRLEDDSAFARQASGITFDTPDRGVEIGLETARWSAQLAVTNGTAGGAETDDGKQVSVRAEHVRTAWRAGASFSLNETEVGDRQLAGVFAGLRTGPIAWLAEADYIEDDGFPDGQRRQGAGLLEANWAYRRGQNLKLTTEYFEPDDDVDEDEQSRWSLVWEYTPVQFLQLRAGVRVYDGIPQSNLQNRRTAFVQLNGYF